MISIAAFNKPLNVLPLVDKEVCLVDVTMKIFMFHLDKLKEYMSKGIHKNKDLATEWNFHISASDKYIKSLKPLFWKKLY